MKKLYFLIFLSILLGLHLSSLNIFAQTCSQLSLPENALARFCAPDGHFFINLDFSPDGKTLASVTRSRGIVVLWDIEKKVEKITIEANGVSDGISVRFSPDGKSFVCGDAVYDAITGEPKLLLLDAEGYNRFVIYSPDGETLAGAGSKGIRFWQSNVDRPSTEALPVGDTSINVLPTDTSENANKASPTSIPIATSSTRVPNIRGLSYSPDGKELAVPCGLGVWIYDVESNSEKTLLTRKGSGYTPVVGVAYSPDGNTLISHVGYGFINVWDATTKKLKFTIAKTKTSSSLGDVTSIEFTQDSKIFISGDAGTDQIHFWDTETGVYKYTLPGHRTAIYSAMLSPSENTIASTSSDGTILLWDITSYPIVSISPDSATSFTIGDEFAFDVKIANAKNMSAYQATIEFDPDALEYVETKYGDYLSGGVPVQPIANQQAGTVQLASLSLSGDVSDGDGVLATIKFKVNAIRTSKIGLRDVILSDPEGKKSYAWIEGAEILKTIITEDGESITCSTIISEDVNKDCLVNIQDLVLVATNFGKGGGNASDVNSDGRVDIIDLVLVAGAFGNNAGAPTVHADAQHVISAFNVQEWLQEAQKVNITDPTFQRGIENLQSLLASLIPEKTALLANYPNPFNPETWIPYQLATPANVTISIYSADGPLVRTLVLGNQSAGLYQNRSRAAYWDGKNSVGESVASGIYFYTLSAGEWTATRKMLILK